MAQIQTNQAPTATEATCLAIEENRHSKRAERKELQVSINKEIETILSEQLSVQDGLSQLQALLEDARIDRLHELIEEMMNWDVLTTIPEPKTFLFNAKLQPSFAKMLESNIKYQSHLECFITRFDAVNERIYPDLNTPLHYAVESLNIDFIKWLLTQPNLAINCRNKQRKTALFLLCEQYDSLVNSPKFKKRTLHVTTASTNTEDIRQCILMLLEHGADFNICSDRLQLPFELLIRNKSKDNKLFVKECLKRCDDAIAIGKTNELKRRVVAFYQDWAYVKVTIELLELYLRFGEEDKFAREFDRINIDSGNVREVIKILLHIAVELNLESSVKKIVDSAKKQIFQVERARKLKHLRVCHPDMDEDNKSSELTYRVELKGLLKKACECGNVTTLNLLLNHITDRVLINDEPILVITLNRAHELHNREDEQFKVLQCADLLSKDQKIHLSRTDNNGNTALHSALKFGFTDVALALLRQKYAFLGVRNKDGLTPLNYARYDFWKMYFDQCVSIDVKRSYFDRNELRLNLNGFDPYIFKRQPVKKSAPKDRSELNLWRIVEKASASNVNPKEKQSFVTEIDPVKIIAKSKELQRLLLHPVIYTFILVKWLRLTKWSYINLFCTLVTVICFSWHSLDSCNGGETSTALTVLAVIGAIYMSLREAIQFVFLRYDYFTSVENYLDIATIISMCVVLSNGCNSIVSSLTIIAFAMQLTVLVGSLPFNSLSTYMYMFKTVSVNFLKSFLLFIPLLSAFTFSFFISYNDQTSISSIDIPAENNSFNQFATFSSAALKTLVMTTGEFEAAAVDFSGGKIILFVLFIFFAPIVILNLINGLAVSDITTIRDESELISISKKVFILERYERGLRNIPFDLIRRLFPSPFFEKHSYVIVVRPKEFRKILVQHINKPTVDHQQRGGHFKIPKAEWLVVPNLPGAWFVRGSEGFFVNLRFLKFPLFSTLDDHILDEALRIADQGNLVKEILDSRRLEIAPVIADAALETEVKLEELRLEMEKMNRLLNKLVMKGSLVGKKLLAAGQRKGSETGTVLATQVAHKDATKRKELRGKKTGKKQTFKTVGDVACAIGKFKKSKKHNK
ncbi:transient receptor potential cation channel protein painless-like [Topomyia yanbarensis]|uniref:transient receptor potential cation channel protein painless-like n=1 Tax=Topomyia yanbarensis TaxID=2498891 RepID=UPI00273C3343|nr:transient receptor potential cation channel protein painless-like [Topomyia yanbarensis]